ncbi:MAG: DedA family protein [Prevotella sp.]|jgi:membrane protein DedA with SNARE-associated domain|nr:DedA family protein [Prevotella sp.]MDO4933301.1 DedA family protein [Prevotella sp.]
MNILYSLLDNLNYGTILFLMLIESTFIPFPSEVVVPPAAYNAAAGELNVFLVVLFATIGADLGAAINYGLAYYLGRPFIYRFANSRWGKLCLLNQEKIEKSEKFFTDHGVTATLVGRVLPAIRQLISIPAGLAKMNFAKFIIYTTIGAGVWNSILAAMGWYLHSFVPKNQLDAKITEYSEYIKAVIIAAVLLAIAYFIIRAIIKNSHKNAAGR